MDLEIWDVRKSRTFIKQRWKVTLHEKINVGYDLIFVGVNTEQLSEAADYLAKYVGSTTVLFFNNLWNNLEASIAPIPINQAIFGFPGAGGGMDGNQLRGGFLKTVFLESPRAGTEARNNQVRQLFQSAGFKVGVKGYAKLVMESFHLK